MKVGTAAAAAGVSPKAVRLWESRGLLPPARRTDSGYRIFTDDDVRILRFIRQAKALDLGLDEIGEILDLQREGTVTCDRVTSLLTTHLDRIDRAIADLRQLRRTLGNASRLAAESRRRGHDAIVCPIIEAVPLPETTGTSRPRGTESFAHHTGTVHLSQQDVAPSR